ncbi:uncharacterized protein BCR38DRAFT_335820 [Pseudomassariella vexata]|uniref:Cell surface protein n=1 Tax=Pseudomassariella vexata TaxID=1141098 RepID=A0A1Y2EAZ7_9PEZI|nr:uncharacterized protein BCR38DRAFT_335820 [Pseudomassariella vexata]ORY68474.1 hypothetical protein BCR38DRAFT_335820 [Pseudomassariella vexata]
MRYSMILAASGLLATVSGHGTVTKVVGANGVEMPGLSIADGTPRDCSSNGCGSQADTAIIRDREIQSGKTGPLGRTQGNGNIDASTMINSFMGAGSAPTNNGTGVGEEDNIPDSAKAPAKRSSKFWPRQFSLAGLLGGGGADNAAQGTKSTAAAETMVKATAGTGATSGMPTCADDGTISMQFRQINQDGAGPLEAAVDGTSGGTDAAAFKEAEVTQDVPGLGIQGLSLATNTDFDVKVAMPAGMTCDATVGQAQNVCVARVRNGAGAGPFGGSVAFTQTPAARKRAIAYRIKKRAEDNRRKVRSFKA